MRNSSAHFSRLRTFYGLRAQFADGPPTLLQAPLLDGLNCGSMNERLATSVEVTASKIFPAGAGWQLASIVADSAGFAPTSLAFFAAVGLGDCTGVFLGHLAYQTLKKVTGAKLNLKDEFQTASLLGTAAFFSGGIWQPALNAFNTLGYTFTQSLVGVSLATTFAFFAGLRIMRRVLSQFMPAVENVTYDNQESDLALSAAVGTGCGACSSAPTSRSAPPTGWRPSSASRRSSAPRARASPPGSRRRSASWRTWWCRPPRSPPRRAGSTRTTPTRAPRERSARANKPPARPDGCTLPLFEVDKIYGILAPPEAPEASWSNGRLVSSRTQTRRRARA